MSARRIEPVRRFRDDGRSEHSFVDEILVMCPRCGARGHIKAQPSAPHVLPASVYEPRQFTCSACPHRMQWHDYSLAFFRAGEPRDPFLNLRLWLQVPTRHGVLFAYNTAHLEWIENFVAARLRERWLSSGYANRSMASRLPRWIKLARNREDVLRALGRLRRRLAER